MVSIPKPGAMCRPPSGCQGLITCIVRNASGEPCLMSCSHVLAASPTPSLDDVVEWLDTNQTPAVWTRAGTLWKWVNFAGDGGNNLDVALAILDSDIAREFEKMPELAIASYDRKYQGAPMSKFSTATNRWQTGTVQDLFVDKNVPFESLGDATFTLCGLIESQVRNGSGDSGSIVLVEDGPLAIHIAGDSVNRSWSIPLQRAFDAWNLQMLDYPVP